MSTSQSMALRAPNDRSAEKRSRLQKAISDLVGGLVQWRIFSILAILEVRQRYRRSSLGQFWVTISMAAQIVGVGVVFGVVFNQPLTDYIPFLGVGMVLWAFIAGLVNELTTAFISSEIYLRGYPGPRSSVIYRTIARNLITTAHNFLLIPLLLLVFQIPIDGSVLLFIPGLLLVMLNGVWIGMLIGTLATRFRDLPQLISNMVQLAFFVTPIMFRPQQVQERLWPITHFNPFASWIEIMRAPLLGTIPELHHWLFAGAVTILGFAVAIPFYARFRGRIVYWL
jgi:ABC-type polysaccharide/polyol phosphate export permease